MKYVIEVSDRSDGNALIRVLDKETRIIHDVVISEIGVARGIVAVISGYARLRATNKELVEALEEIEEKLAEDSFEYADEALEIAYRTLAKAKEPTP